VADGSGRPARPDDPEPCIYLPKNMTDPRYKKLASLLVNYSTEIKRAIACSWT
jgi:hypothetical protein